MLEIFGHCIFISQSFWGSHLIWAILAYITKTPLSLLLSHYDQYGDFRAVAAAELAEKKEQEAEESAKVASAMKPSLRYESSTLILCKELSSSIFQSL